jgi:hypothetical protein
MDVLNFGHGVFIALGAFVATSVLGAMGDYTASASLWRNMLAVLPAMVIAMLVAGAVGVAFERFIVRPVYGNHLKQILITMGGMIIGEELIKVIWGPLQIPLPLPEAMRGALLIGDAAVEKFRNHPAGKLSGGQTQMLAVSRAIVEPRELLIVDEPSKGLAPAIINNMIDAFAQLKSRGVTILLVEQNINFAKRLGDTVAVMDNGVVVHAGSMKELAEDEALQHSLLGLAI